MNVTHLELSWTTSRGRETYGYNIVRLVDTSTGERFRAMGGGYDMTGTVFGEWLQTTYQDRLREIAGEAHQSVMKNDEGPWGRTYNDHGLYGMTLHKHDGSVHLDGACGLSSMQRIAERVGLEVRAIVNRRGSTTGFLVNDTRES
jgi:hypothetical protein